MDNKNSINTTTESLFENPEAVINQICTKFSLDKINEELPNYQQIKDFVLGYEEWTIENNLLTNTLKPKRKTLLELNEKDLTKLYA